MKRYLKYISTFIFLLLILVGFNACVNDQQHARQLVDEKKSNETLNQRSYLAELGLVLPKKANIVYFYQEEGGELYIRLKIEINSQEFNNWVSSFNSKEEYFTESNRYLLEPDFKEWQPSMEPMLFAQQIASDQGTFLNLGVTSKGEIEGKKSCILFFMELKNLRINCHYRVSHSFG